MNQNSTKFDKNTGAAAQSGNTPERAKPLESLPRAPEWLRDEALDEWNRIGPGMIARRVLTAESITMFAHYCAISERMIVNMLAGEPSAALMSQWRLYAADLLITPMSQAKLPASQKTDKPANQFGKLTAVK
jgi:phage terminase small subunit